MRTSSTLLVDVPSWDDLPADWTATTFVFEFWNLASSHVLARWGGTKTDLDDLNSITASALTDFADAWMRGEMVEGEAIQDKRLFWSWFKKRIQYRMLDALRDVSDDASVDDNPEENSEYWSNQLRARISNDSHTNIELVRTMTKMRPGVRVVLALAFFEELPHADIIRLMGENPSRAKKIGTEMLLRRAVSLVVDNPPLADPLPDALAKWSPSPALVAWLDERYGVPDVGQYLDWVAAMFAIDASYMVDALWFSHGVHRQSRTARNALRIDLEANDARELTEARYAARMTQAQACRALAQKGIHLIQAHLSRFERMKSGLRPELVAALREVYAAAVPTRNPGSGAAPRRARHDY